MSRISKIWSYSKEDLKTIVEESVSMSDLLRKLGYNTFNGSRKAVIRCLESYEIDWKMLSFKGKHNYGKVPRRIISNKEMFRKNGTISRHALKRRILKDNLIEYRCSICGMSPEWNEKELVLILDHINGVNNDNRLENLRFVCPNCNSQLETFAARNVKKNNTDEKYWNKCNIKKRSKTCPICGAPMNEGSKKCNKCELKRRHNLSKKPPKEELAKDLLTLSMISIGKKYGVTDNSVRKWCKFYGLPCKYNEIQEFRKKNLQE